LVVGLPGLLAAFLIFLTPEIRHVTVPKNETVGYSRWLRSRADYLGGLVFGCGFCAILAQAVGSWNAVYLARHFGFNMGLIGVRLGIAQGTCGLIGFVLSGWLVDKLGAERLRNPHFVYLMWVAGALTVLVPVTFTMVENEILVFVLMGLIQLI